MSDKILINPRELFSSEILDFEVDTVKYGKTNYVNLDNAATTPPFKVVSDGVQKYLDSYGSVHRGAGTKSKISTDAYEDSREVIKNFVGAPKDTYVLLTENTTEAMNVAAYFFSFLKGKVAVSAIEHSSSWLPWIKAEGIKALGEKQYKENEMDNVNDRIQLLGRGQVLQYYVDDKFELDFYSIEKLLQYNFIKVVILTASSNINGYCPDIKRVGELAHKYGAYFLVDACQFIQHHKINMQEMGIDFLAASGHKFYAPFGEGFLIGPKKFFDKFLPYQIGGGNLPYITEQGEFLRYKNQLAHDPGTPNAVGAVSLSLALKELKKIGLENIEEYEKNLTKKLFDYFVSNPKIEIFVSEGHLNTVIPFRIKGMDSAAVAEILNNDYGIGIRAGSFCVYHVIRKLLKIEDDSEIIASVKCGNTDRIPSLVRASIGLCNTEADIDRIIEAISEITK
ncbi:MAG: aminotransferase class V-fold PLP-dependent enzyme [bacterium]|nr:aminotransferase class V-fold PLP-dependent enzyme [bacterium]